MAFEHERTVTISEEEAPWAPEEELGEYKIIRWRWYDKQNALANSAVIVDEEKDKATLDMGEYYARMFKVCVIPPEGLKWNLERIKALDPDVGEILVSHVREINGLIWKEKSGFLKPSDPGKTIPG